MGTPPLLSSRNVDLVLDSHWVPLCVGCSRLQRIRARRPENECGTPCSARAYARAVQEVLQENSVLTFGRERPASDRTNRDRVRSGAVIFQLVDSRKARIVAARYARASVSLSIRRFMLRIVASRVLNESSETCGVRSGKVDDRELVKPLKKVGNGLHWISMHAKNQQCRPGRFFRMAPFDEVLVGHCQMVLGGREYGEISCLK